MRCAGCSLLESGRACLLPNTWTSPPLFLKTTLCISPLIDKHDHRFYIKCFWFKLVFRKPELSFELSTFQESPFGFSLVWRCACSRTWVPAPCQGLPGCLCCCAYRRELMSSLFSPARPVLGRFSPTLAKYTPSNNKLSWSIANCSCCTRDITSALICPLITLSCLGSSHLPQIISDGFVFRQFEKGKVWALFSDRWFGVC